MSRGKRCSCTVHVCGERNNYEVELGGKKIFVKKGDQPVIIVVTPDGIGYFLGSISELGGYRFVLVEDKLEFIPAK